MKVNRLFLSLSLLVVGQSFAQQPIDVIEVVGQTPLGAVTNADQIASNIQSATAEDLAEQRALSLANFMGRNLASVFVNEAQSNPLQPDVQYRGFVGSPLLGLPQGIAVYQDSVRINEPFGDTVNWALIPDSAIESVHLMPGSNPLFGLNALGGAIVVETKDGFSSPGTRAELYGGSFGRVGLQAETGGSTNDRFSYFLTAAFLEEDGWRDYSPTEALQVFGNLGWQSVTTSIDLGVSLADTDLIGNGPAPMELLEDDRRAIFTRPDRTANELTLINLIAEHEVTNDLTLTGNLYLRGSDIDTFNGDDSDFVECQSSPGFICEDEELVFDQGGNPISVSSEIEGATINRTDTRQDGKGIGIQAAWSNDLFRRDNSFILGFAIDNSDINFSSSTELGKLDATRLAIPGGVFVGESFIRLNVETSTLGIYLSNTIALFDNVALTVSGRFNDTDVSLRDQLGTELSGDHSFDRFNPAIGVTTSLTDTLGFYASYSESNRTPSPVELTCADENDPCRLPNAFVADPPLEQVVANTFEAGLRGKMANGSWHVGVFSTTNKDDILFISAGSLTGQGFFDNIGRTQRDGIEMNVDGQAGDYVTWFVNYSYIDATFRENVYLPSPNNPEAIGDEIEVVSGDRLPLIPRQLFKGGIRVEIGERATINGDILAGGDFHMRGDEGNDSARIGDHVVVNLRGDYRLNDTVLAFLNVDNVLDEEYETFGLFGEASDVLGNVFGDSRFLSPAAPRAAWIGVQLTF